jgi:two-component system cell cycle response regulator
MGIETREFAVGEGVIRLTVSIGVSTFPAANVASADDLFARADAAMYRAKQDGRNQVRS